MKKCELDERIDELKRKEYAEYGYGEQLTPHSYKCIQVTSDCFKLYVCDKFEVIEVTTYDQDGYLIEKATLTYGKPESAPNVEGEPATDFPSRDIR